ncbi:MAG: peptide deformylase [Candidatus Levybacteria bacterium]|nr:peptide deformylase [Candidatus Levybacteria bacterium]
MLKIITAPDRVLSQRAKRVKKIDKSILEFVEEMKMALLAAKDPEGVGLAAPQVGKSLSVFITKQNAKSPIKVFINPHLKLDQINFNPENKNQKRGAKKSISKRLEGCLSLPNIWGHVKRGSNLSISYQDENGKNHSKKFTGFMATIIQHEMDHLNGALFTKRVLQQNGILYKSHKNEQGEDIFEEIEV